MAKKIRFCTDSLLSKWGFCDGDKLEDLFFSNINKFNNKSMGEHDLLVLTVKKFIIPKIKNNIEIEEIITNHNPIRASKVDNKNIDWFNDTDIKLEPEYIDVNIEEIINLMK